MVGMKYEERVEGKPESSKNTDQRRLLIQRVDGFVLMHLEERMWLCYLMKQV